MTLPHFDLGQLNEMFQAGQNLAGLGKGALALLKTLKAKLADTTDQALKAELMAMLGDLTEKLLEAQIAQATVLDRLRDFERTLVAAQRDAEEAQRYQLATLPGGGVALSLKEGDPQGEPFHYLCQPCFADGKKRVLQPYGRSQTTLECPGCKSLVRNYDEGGIRNGGRVLRGD